MLNPDVIDISSDIMSPNLYYLCFHTFVLNSSGIDFHMWCDMRAHIVFLPMKRRFPKKSFSSVLQAVEANAGDNPVTAAFLDFLQATFLPLISCIKSLSALHF